MANQKAAFDFLTKIILIGDDYVGKTSLLIQFCERTFGYYLGTVGVDFKMKIMDVDGRRIKAEFWDTSGNERSKKIIGPYYKNAMGFILTYSVTERQSFDNIENWMKHIRQHASDDVCMILIGNKCDTDTQYRKISYEEGKRLADSHGIQFFETSAKEDLNVHEAFEYVVKEVKKKFYGKADFGADGKRIRAKPEDKESRNLLLREMSMQKKAYDFLAKILLIGDTAVGKTCLVVQFCENSFKTSHITTIEYLSRLGIDFKMKTIDVDDKKIKLQVWDTAGQERFETISQAFYRGAMGIILSYSVTDRKSFEDIEKWMEQIKEHASEDVCKILIGNKCDMQKERMVLYEEGKMLADWHGIQFFETSAKENLNVQETFICIAKEVVKKFAKNEMCVGTTTGDNERQRISVVKSQAKKPGCC